MTTTHGAQYLNEVSVADRNLGAGGAFGDYDGDGYPDLYVCSKAASNVLYRNLAGTGFEDVTNGTGLAAPARESTGALWGDYDNDGDQDLFVMNRGSNILMRNDGSDGSGGWNFTNVAAGLGGTARTSAAAWGDYDNDGFLDLYVANHSYEIVAPVPGAPFHSDKLYRNIAGTGGERVFQDVTSASLNQAILDISVAHSVGFFDYDNDNDLDIYVVNEDQSNFDPAITGENLLWRNDGSDGSGGWLFTEVGASVGLAHLKNPMGLAIGDYNSDGWFDLAMSDFGANTLYENNNGVFTDVGTTLGIGRPVVPDGSTQISWGLVFTDYDLDGDEDLYVGAGTLTGAITQPNVLFRAEDDGSFTELSPAESGGKVYRSTRTVVKADYDRDGDEDLYIVNYGQECVLLQNTQSGGDFLALRLVGTTSNRDAIGARVKVSSAGEPDQLRMVQSGSTTGGSHDLTLYFGCKDLSAVDQITIDWPSGQQSVLNNVTVNQFVTVVEP
jgi:hypothetical protein